MDYKKVALSTAIHQALVQVFWGWLMMTTTNRGAVVTVFETNGNKLCDKCIKKSLTKSSRVKKLKYLNSQFKTD